MAVARKAAIVRGTSRHTLSSQIEMARRAGCKPIFVLGRKVAAASDLRFVTFDEAVRTFRAQDEICLPYPYVIADPARCKRGRVREYFDECIDAIDDRGPVFIDMHNGLRSDDKAQRRLLLKLGRQGAASAGKGIATAANARRGRKKNEPAAEVIAEARSVWLNRRDYPTLKDVRAALPKGVTQAYCYRTFKARTKRAT